VTIEHTLPKENNDLGFPTLNITQYEEYVIHYAVHNHKHLSSIPLNIYYDDKLISTVNAENNTINPYTFRPKDSGKHYIKFEIDNYTKIIKLNVQETNIDIQDTTTNLLLDLSALNRNYKDDDRDS
jgi:hypothetical protein